MNLHHARLLCPWDFPGKNTGVSGHFLIQVISLAQGLNPHLLPWQVESLPLSHLGRPKMFPSTMINSFSINGKIPALTAEETESLTGSDPPAWTLCSACLSLPRVGWMKTLWFLGGSFVRSTLPFTLYRNQEMYVQFTPGTTPCPSDWECAQSCGLSIWV